MTTEKKYSGGESGGGKQNRMQSNCRQSGGNCYANPGPNQRTRHYQKLLPLDTTHVLQPLLKIISPVYLEDLMSKESKYMNLDLNCFDTQIM